MLRFFKDNNIAMTGSPFVLYTMYDVANNRTTLSVCLPMKEEIYTSEGSDYTSGNLHPFQAVKTILEGDYSHSKAWDKTFDYIKRIICQKIKTELILKYTLLPHHKLKVHQNGLPKFIFQLEILLL